MENQTVSSSKAPRSKLRGINIALQTAGFRQPSHQDAENLHEEIQKFKFYPEEAYVPIKIVCELFACSPATVWRRVRSGLLVKPHRIGQRTTRWRVGDLREALRQVNSNGSAK